MTNRLLEKLSHKHQKQAQQLYRHFCTRGSEAFTLDQPTEEDSTLNAFIRLWTNDQNSDDDQQILHALLNEPKHTISKPIPSKWFTWRSTVASGSEVMIFSNPFYQHQRKRLLPMKRSTPSFRNWRHYYCIAACVIGKKIISIRALLNR